MCALLSSLFCYTETIRMWRVRGRKLDYYHINISIKFISLRDQKKKAFLPTDKIEIQKTDKYKKEYWQNTLGEKTGASSFFASL